eukprot:g8393.t1
MRFVQKLFKHLEFLLALCGSFSLQDGLTMMLKKTAESCLVHEWKLSGTRSSNLQNQQLQQLNAFFAQIAFVDRINMLKMKKLVELSHGFGSLFEVENWKTWLTNVLKIHAELSVSCNVDSHALFRRIAAVKAGVRSLPDAEDYKLSDDEQRQKSVFLHELRQHRNDFLHAIHALFNEVSVRLSEKNLALLVIALLDHIMVIVAELDAAPPMNRGALSTSQNPNAEVFQLLLSQLSTLIGVNVHRIHKLRVKVTTRTTGAGANKDKNLPLLMDVMIKRFFDYIHVIQNDKSLQKQIIHYLAITGSAIW